MVGGACGGHRLDYGYRGAAWGAEVLKKHWLYKQTGALGSGIVEKTFAPLLFGAKVLKKHKSTFTYLYKFI